jgi:hypothetical protein
VHPDGNSSFENPIDSLAQSCSFGIAAEFAAEWVIALDFGCQIVCQLTTSGRNWCEFYADYLFRENLRQI